MKMRHKILLSVSCLLVIITGTVCTSNSSGGSGSETPNVMSSKKKFSQITENDTADLLLESSIDTIRGVKKSPSSFGKH